MTGTAPPPHSELPDRIYQAQCFGSVEPVEHMVPYPNLPSLIQGQMIKSSRRLLWSDTETNLEEFFAMVQRTARWLQSLGLSSGDRVLVWDGPHQGTAALAFGIWSCGATLVLPGSAAPETLLPVVRPALTCTSRPPDQSGTRCFPFGPDPHQYPGCLAAFPPAFEPRHQSLLSDEALVTWSPRGGLRLSHYNLLVNTNGVRRLLNLEQDDSLRIDLAPASSAWLVLQVLLPLYAGAAAGKKPGKLTLGRPGQYPCPDYLLEAWEAPPSAGDPAVIRLLPENTAVLTVAGKPVPLTALDTSHPKHLRLQGHSVMQGYLEASANDTAFHDGWLHIPARPKTADNAEKREEI